MLQKELRTERLYLVPLSESHMEYQIELDSDPEVMRFLYGPRSKETCERELATLMLAATRDLGYWARFVQGKFAGYWILCVPEMLVSDGDKAPLDIGELGYRLLPRFWRRGLASEGSRELLRYGFEDLDLNKIVAFTAAKNTASRATMESVGMDFVQYFEVELEDWSDGADRDGVEYPISAKDQSINR